MKKSNFVLIGFTLITQVLGSCSLFDFDNCTKGKGESTVSEFSFSRVTALKIEIPADVYLVQDSTILATKIEVFGQSNVKNNIGFEVDTLTNEMEIKFSDCVSAYQPIELTIYTNSINQFEIVGPASVYTKFKYYQDSLNLFMNAAGSMDMVIHSRKLNTIFEGAGNLTLNGYAGYSNIEINSIGALYGFGLQTDSSTVSMNNTGLAEVFVGKKLWVNFGGAGVVNYKGNPIVFQNGGETNQLVDAN